jgi:hypothetical protein
MNDQGNTLPSPSRYLNLSPKHGVVRVMLHEVRDCIGAGLNKSQKVMRLNQP